MSFKTLEKILIEKGWASKPDSLKGITTGSPYFIKTEEKGVLKKIGSILNKDKNKIYLFDIIKKYTRMIFDKSIEKEIDKNPNLMENLSAIAGIGPNREAIVTSTYLDEDHLASTDEIILLDKKFVGYTKVNIKVFSAYPEKIKINTIYKEEPKLAREIGQKDPLKPKKSPILDALKILAPRKKIPKGIGLSLVDDLQQTLKHQKMMSGMNEIKAGLGSSQNISDLITNRELRGVFFKGLGIKKK